MACHSELVFACIALQLHNTCMQVAALFAAMHDSAAACAVLRAYCVA